MTSLVLRVGRWRAATCGLAARHAALGHRATPMPPHAPPTAAAAAAPPAAHQLTCALHTWHAAHEESSRGTATTATTPARRRASASRTSLAASNPPTPASTPTPLPSAAPTFSALKLPTFLTHRLTATGIHRPTPIQAAAIPHLLRRPWDAASYPDVLVQEMTGQGKTLAYLLPIVANIDRTLPAVQAVIVVPTRELATQLTRVVQELTGNLPGAKPLPHALSVATLVGQANPTMLSSLVRSAGVATPPILSDEFEFLTTLQHHPHLLIGTPGVLHEIFVQRKLSDVHDVLPLTHLKYIVFDEADTLINASASRNVIVPLINLRHHATGLELEKVKAEQKRLEVTKEQRRKEKMGEVDEEEFDPNEVPPMPEEMKQEDARLARERAASESTGVPAVTPTFPRNQVVFVSATVTTAVHQFAARYLGPSRAFITQESVAGVLSKKKEGKLLDGSSSTLATDALVAPSSTPAVQRIPPHIKHYYLVVNRPYDRLNSLQQLLQAIKLQFESWKKTQLLRDDIDVEKTQTVSHAWMKKLLGPERALSAGGVRKQNEVSRTRFLKGGVASMGAGAAGHFIQSSLVFTDSKELPTLVNPLSQQGFNLGVVSEHSGRHERREALRVDRTELLLATDVLSRGMDLKSLTHVVNYSLPDTPNIYLHRAGRVGRLGAVHSKIGSVVTLVDLQADPRALDHLQKLAKTLHIEMARIYVKKGKLFEDGNPDARLTETNLPKVEDFIVDKAARPKTDAKRTPDAKRERPKRLLTGQKKTVIVNGVKYKAAAEEEARRRAEQQSQTESSSTPPPTTDSSARSTVAAPQLPLDPIGAHLGLGAGLKDLPAARIAQLELTQGAGGRKKSRGAKPDRQV